MVTMKTTINAVPSSSSVRLEIREIADADIDPVINLLVRGFPRPRRYWEVRLGRLRMRSLLPNMPRYGYLLEADGKPVGVILLISSLRRMGDRQELFSNLSGWYVEPDFRSGATQLLKRALANKQATYLNLYPAIHVRPIIEAFGFRRYSEGQFLALLALAHNQRNRAHVLSEWITSATPILKRASGDCSRHRQVTAASLSAARRTATRDPLCLCPAL